MTVSCPSSIKSDDRQRRADRCGLGVRSTGGILRRRLRRKAGGGHSHGVCYRAKGLARAIGPDACKRRPVIQSITSRRRMAAVQEVNKHKSLFNLAISMNSLRIEGRSASPSRSSKQFRLGSAAIGSACRAAILATSAPSARGAFADELRSRLDLQMPRICRSSGKCQSDLVPM